MLKNIYKLFLIATFLFFSCHKQSDLNKDFNCDITKFNNVEIVGDMKKLFSIEIPKHWKTNLYQDEVQSSIFTADTTKQLKETILLDITFVEKKINFDEAFLLQQEQKYLSKNLIKIKSKRLKNSEKPTLYMVYKGKKGNFNYQICNTFIKINTSNFILAKTEVYGDSLVNQRLCKAFSLIEKIKLLQE